MNNIYDLEGNYYEWTAEATAMYGRTNRGGNYRAAFTSLWISASNRANDRPTFTYGDNSARPALYVNL